MQTVEPIPTSIDKALKILMSPLKFGDPVQIRAVRYVERIETCAAAIARCKSLDSYDGDEIYEARALVFKFPGRAW